MPEPTTTTHNDVIAAVRDLLARAARTACNPEDMHAVAALMAQYNGVSDEDKWRS